jgi:hypothetical protein
MPMPIPGPMAARPYPMRENAPLSNMFPFLVA